MASDTNTASQNCSNNVSFWKPDGVQEFLATSAHFFVGILEDGRTVLKFPHRNTPDHMTLDARACLREEADRYARLGSHENLVTYKGINEHRLLLEYCEGGPLGDLIESPFVLTDSHKALISSQVISCLAFLHRRNHIHCDIHVRNIFLTSKLSAKIGDLQDGSVEMETMAQEGAKSRHPRVGEDEFTARTDIFALGTLLYHLWHGHPPFPELDIHAHHDLIETRIRERQYPADLDECSGIDAVIGKCWDSKYERAEEILDDMRDFGAKEVPSTSVN
jgi:serine/threonine protein kinase